MLPLCVACGGIEVDMQGKRLGMVVLLALVAVLGADLRATEPAARCERVVAVGDLHGGYEALVTILRETALVDSSLRWAGGEACLVQQGDVLDRGPRSREIVELLIDLQRQAPGRVHVLLGNHEVMNLVGDLRYVSAEDFRAFAAEETLRERERGYREFLATHAARSLEPGRRREAFEARFPRGWFARRRALSPEGWLGRWLLSRPAMVEIDGTLFVHGGVSVAEARLGIDELSRRVTGEVRRYLAVREELERARVLEPLTPFGDDRDAVERYLETAGSGQREGYARIEGPARELLALHDEAIFLQPDGLLWSRSLSDDDGSGPGVMQALAVLGAERLVVAHTPTRDDRIVPRFDGSVFLIDTGAGPSSGGRVSALEIAGGDVRAIYAGERPVLLARSGERSGLRASVASRGSAPATTAP